MKMRFRLVSLSAPIIALTISFGLMPITNETGLKYEISGILLLSKILYLINEEFKKKFS